MTSPKPDLNSPPRFQTARAVIGVLLALVGSSMLVGLVVIGNCSARPCEKLLFELGLATTGLVSATAQGLVLGGLWLLWTAFSRARSGRT
jgi:hypothetical protein